jgi:GntR family transcriptional regulator/MocR family aminotransferase
MSGRTTPGSDFLHLDPSAAPARGLTDWLTAALRTAILDRRLAAGSRLPATRVLAADLGVARGVVLEAYQRLRDEGLTTARPRAGTIVLPARHTPDPAAPSAPAEPVQPFLVPSAEPGDIDIDLSPGVPDLSLFPRTAWLRAERTVLAGASAADLGYGDPRGAGPLRQELSGWLARTRGVHAAPQGIIVVAGVAQAIALLAQTLRARGATRIAVEDPGSRGARDELSHWGLDPVPVGVDADGVQVAQLAETGVPAAFLTPAHQYPTGVALAPARRRELLSWAARTDALVIEDDYDAEHRYDRAPVPALQASAPEHVAHTGSTSKTLAPAMRLGWLVPPRDLHAELVAAKYASDLGCPLLPQLALAHLIATGAYDRHIRQARTRQRARRDAMLTAFRAHLPGAGVEGIAAGLHLLVTFPELGSDVSDTELAERLAQVGVRAQPLSWHRLRPGPAGLVLGYAAHPPDRLREAARRIGSVVRGLRATAVRHHV